MPPGPFPMTRDELIKLAEDVCSRTEPPIPSQQMYLVWSNIAKVSVFERLYFETIRKVEAARTSPSERRKTAARIYNSWFPDPADRPIALNRLLHYLCKELERGHRDSSAGSRFRDRALQKDPRCVWPLGCRVTDPRDLEADHRMPHAWGGSDEEDNFQLLCRFHNRLKGTSLFWGDLPW